MLFYKSLAFIERLIQMLGPFSVYLRQKKSGIFVVTSVPKKAEDTLSLKMPFYRCEGFPHSSVSKESACNAGDPSSIPGLGRSAGKGIGYPLQYSWASLVAQLVKNLPAIQETPVQFLGWEDPLETRKSTHFSILAWRIPWTV